MNKTVYRVIVMCVATILLVGGTYIGLKLSDKVVQNTNVVSEPVTNSTETTVPTVSKEETKDIEVTYEDYYTLCKETITNKNMEFGTTIEKIKEKTDKSYQVVEETEESIVFRKEIDSYCPNHFKLILENGYVMIYQIVSDSVSTIYKNTEIPKANIREELIVELEKGIRVDSLEALNSYIEDIES